MSEAKQTWKRGRMQRPQKAYDALVLGKRLTHNRRVQLYMYIDWLESKLEVEA